MKFLLEEGFSTELIDKLEKKFDPATIELLEIESDNVIEVINYLREIGIKNIETIILTYVELFTRDIDDVKKEFNKHNIPDVVAKINEDIFYIENI